MFDLRYHVASLTAVFLALIIGILVGVGISSGGFVRKSERRILNDRISELEHRLEVAQLRGGELSRAQRASDTFIEQSYPVLMTRLLEKKRVGVVFIGAVDPEERALVEQTLSDAGGGNPLRMRAIRVPVDLEALDRVLAERPALARFAKVEGARDLGRRLAQEFAKGGKAPVWRLLAPELVEERTGSDKGPADAIVVVRSALPQQGATARLLRGFYEGLAVAGVPAVGVETSRRSPTAVDAYEKARLSSVDFVESRVGRLALALLLAGAEPGNYGLKPTATDGIMPMVPPLTEARASTGG